MPKPRVILLALKLFAFAAHPFATNAGSLNFDNVKEVFQGFSYTERVRFQSSLRKYGYNSSLDGLFGKGTFAAVQNYTKQSGIENFDADIFKELLATNNAILTTSSTERTAQFSVPIISKILERTDYVNFGAVALGDFDGDNQPELLMSSMHNRYMQNVWSGDKPKRDVHWLEKNKLFDALTFYSLLNSGNETMAVTNYKYKIVGDEYKCLQAAQVVTGDLNGDGIDDVAIGCHGYDKKPWPGGPQAILLSRGNKVFEVKEVISKRTFVNSIVMIDADRDGDLDIIFGAKNKKILIIRNDGKGNFSSPSTLFNNYMARRMDAIDLNDDGFDDLIVAGREDKNEPTIIFWSDTSGKFTKKNSLKLKPVNEFPKPKAFFEDENYLFISRASAKHDKAYIQKLNKSTLEEVGSFSFDARHASHSTRVFKKANGVIEMGGLLPDFMTSFSNTDKRFK